MKGLGIQQELQNKNRKKIILLMMIVFVSPIFFGYTFAQGTPSVECNACGVPAPEYVLMTNFMKESLLFIKTLGTKAPYLGKYVNPNRFEAGIFAPPRQSLTSKLMENIKKWGVAVGALASIFTNLRNGWGTKDFMLWFTILFKNKVFFRDYKTLLDIDTLVNDKKYELWLGWWFIDTLNKKNLDQYQKILDKYGPEGEWLFNRATLGPNVSYRQIVLLVMNINSALKTFVTLNTTQQFYSDFTYGGAKDIPDITLYFAKEKIEDMDKKYVCARGLTQCDGSLRSSLTNFQKIWDIFTNGGKDFMKVLSDAKKKFQKRQFNQEEIKAWLKNTYWLNANEIESWGLLGFKNYRSMIVNAWTSIKNLWTDLKNEIKQDNTRVAAWSALSTFSFKKIAILRNLKNQFKDLPWMSNAESDVLSWVINRYIDPLPDKNTIFAKTLTDSSLAVIVDAQKDMELVLIANVTDVTNRFGSMFSTIQGLIDDSIWRKGTKDSLVDNLWKACEAQCSNIPSKECF